MNNPDSYYERDLVYKGILHFSGEVTKESMKELSLQLLTIHEDKNLTSPITLYINSEGGDISACFGTIEMMKKIKNNVITIGMGEICSCGLLLFMAGDHRIVTKTTSILSHAYYWETAGKHHELTAARKEQDLIYGRLIDYYIERTGLKADIIETKLLPATDVWLTPKEALKYKIAHVIK